MLTEDYDSYMGTLLKKEHITLESGYDELMLDTPDNMPSSALRLAASLLAVSL